MPKVHIYQSSVNEINISIKRQRWFIGLKKNINMLAIGD